MNREIKFRGKRIDNGQWVYGQYFITPLTDENSGTTPDSGWFFLTGETRHCIVQNRVAFVIDLNTLGQFTGLKDKNGKEIYEGDIIKSVSLLNDHSQKGAINILVVRNWMGNSCLCFDGQETGTPIYPLIVSHEFEIIGNIYESPSEVTP